MADAASTAVGGSLGSQAMAAVDSGEVESLELENAQGYVDSEDSSEGGEVQDLESWFAEQDEEQKASSDVDDDDDDDDDETPDQDSEETAGRGGRAQRRIRSLSKRLKEQATAFQATQSQLQQQQQWVQQQQQYQQQLAQAYQQQQVEMAKMQAALQAYSQGQQPQKQKDAVDEFQERLLAEAQQKVSPEIQALRQQLEQMQHSQRQQVEAERRVRQRQQINFEADRAVERHIIPFVDEEVVQGDKHMLGSLVVAMAAMNDTDLETAAKTLRRMNMNMSRGVIRKRSSQNGAKLRASKSIPQPSPSGKIASQEQAFPSLSAIRKAGYGDFLQWQMAGSPPVK